MSGSWKKSRQENKLYAYTRKEYVFYSICGMGIVGVFAFVFYKSLFVFLLFFPFAFLYPCYRYKSFKKSRQNQLNIQFKNAMLSVTSSLNAGYSVENAFREAYKEVVLMYGKQAIIVREWKNIVNGLELGWSIETLIEDFAARSEIHDIQNFSEVFQIANKSGGNLCAIIRQTTEMIEDKIRVQEEIVTATTAAQYEGMIMQVMPLLIILYMNLTSGDFFHVLYEGVLGRTFMTICFLAYIGIVILQKKIMEKTC